MLISLLSTFVNHHELSGQAVHKLSGHAVHKLSGQAAHELSEDPAVNPISAGSHGLW